MAENAMMLWPRSYNNGFLDDSAWLNDDLRWRRRLLLHALGILLQPCARRMSRIDVLGRGCLRA